MRMYRVGTVLRMVENQMEGKMDNDMETGLRGFLGILCRAIFQLELVFGEHPAVAI